MRFQSKINYCQMIHSKLRIMATIVNYNDYSRVLIEAERSIDGKWSSVCLESEKLSFDELESLVCEKFPFLSLELLVHKFIEKNKYRIS